VHRTKRAAPGKVKPDARTRGLAVPGLRVSRDHGFSGGSETTASS
jgi:hypothetical protein